MQLTLLGRSFLRAGARNHGFLCLHGSSAVWKWRCFSSKNKVEENTPMTPMLKHLVMKIKSTGPITVAEYMREVLTNPVKCFDFVAQKKQGAESTARGGNQEDPPLSLQTENTLLGGIAAMYQHRMAP